MAQNYTNNSYQGSHIGNVDLVNMQNNFECIRSMFSGPSSPPINPPEGGSSVGMPWFHTTNKLLKMRNKAGSAWIGIMYGDQDQRMWCYANSAIDGWVIDSTAPVDCVVGIKGGSNDYNVNGGQTAGDWQIPDHTLTVSQLAIHTHTIVANHTHNIVNSGSAGSGVFGMIYATTASSVNTSSSGAHTHPSSGGDGGPHNHGNTYRPRAAVGILVHPNV